MSRFKPRRWWFPLLLGLVAVGQGPTSGQNPPRWIAPTSINDPRLDVVRLASVNWELRSGPNREVVDQVCLVPDFPTFLEAIATWDQSHYFPILFDDVDSSLRFIRAFKPARIVRMPRSSAAIPAGKAWTRSVEAVGSSWTNEANPAAPRFQGESVPRDLGTTPPGVVVSSPDAPMLAGAVALAAGRFQPLLRLDYEKRFADTLSFEEAEALNEKIAGMIRDRIPKFDFLGDECDFLTIADDIPYRYRDAKGEQVAVDDRLGRSVGSYQRWAFAGRILGDPTESVYRAMCSLFLQPESALMFNGYDESATPWSDYSMRQASIRLSSVVPTSQVSGEKQANLEGWHETFDPINRFGLVLINSHGSPTVFNVRGGPGYAYDTPRTIPTAVLMIHSFSAAEPNDQSTIAGRWLANGAFIFFGSMNEPYLASFRTPRLVGDLIGERLPLVAAVRATLAEPYGQPWRLVFLGDPLYRLKPKRASELLRVPRWVPTASWPSYSETPRPAEASDSDLLIWSLKTALARLQGKSLNPAPSDDLVNAVLATRRTRLPLNLRPVLDALMTDVLLQARKRSTLKVRIAAIPEAERPPALKKTYETLLGVDLNFSIAQKDASRARAFWSDLIKTDASRDFKQLATTRVGLLADTPVRRHDWSLLLRAALKSRSNSVDAEFISAELKRVDEALKADR